MSLSDHELRPEQLRWGCDPSPFSFNSTEEIPVLKGIVEQERPVRAIRFGLGINSPGYNIYVSGKIDEIKDEYAAFPKVASYLDDVHDQILSHLEDFAEEGQKQETSLPAQIRLEAVARDPVLFPWT